MSGMEDRRSSSVWILLAALLALALPLTYLLSVGPAEAYYQNQPTPDWVVALYSPLAWLAGRSIVFREWLFWYINLWCDH
jgi:hypothetical protein